MSAVQSLRVDGRSSEQPPIRLGLLGFGTVGTGTYRMLRDNREAITRKIGRPVEVVKIGIRDSAKSRMLPSVLFTTDLESVFLDDSIDVVLELIGGTEPAGAAVEGALRAGKHVITANKELIAKDGPRLLKLAKELGLDLHYEAAVGGGIPLVQPLKHQLAGNDLVKMMGILNGTTNYILTKMTEEGSSLEAALSEAQEKGYAEADPTNDVQGFDAAYKIAILGSIALGRQVPVEAIHREGIAEVTAADIHFAEVLGYRIKLVGIVEPHGEGVRVRVHPTLLPRSHPLAAVNGVYNALWLHGDFVGDVMFSGRGAGSDPTASAVVRDLIDVGRNIVAGGSGSVIPYDTGLTTLGMEGLETAYYLRMVVKDRPLVLGRVSTILGEHNVSLSAMEMRVLDHGAGLGEIVFLTHRCTERDFLSSLRRIDDAEIVEEVCNWIRVEES